MQKTHTSTFSNDDVEILEKKPAYQGHFRIEKYQLRHRLFAGGWSKTLTREVFERKDAAAALLFDPVLNKIVLVEQFRMGIINKTKHPWLLEIVAGVIDANETPEEVARRESVEEAGLVIQDVIPIIEYWVSPGGSSEKVSLFCARVDASKAGGIFGLLEEGEEIRVHVFTVQEVYQLLDEQKINNAPTVIAVQWLRLNEAKVRAQWQR